MEKPAIKCEQCLLGFDRAPESADISTKITADVLQYEGIQQLAESEHRAIKEGSNYVELYLGTSGSCYQGYLKNEEPHGPGILVAKSGNKYLGEFKSGELDGFGIAHY